MAQASETVTVDTVRDYIVNRGGVVKNVDLVKHFRSFLQQENPDKKGIINNVKLRTSKLINIFLSFSSGAYFVQRLCERHSGYQVRKCK